MLLLKFVAYVTYNLCLFLFSNLTKPELIPKSYKSVWEHFVKPAAGSTGAKCKLCIERTMIKRNNYGTSGLISHLKSAHGLQKEKQVQSAKADPANISSSDSAKSNKVRMSFVWKHFTKFTGNKARCNERGCSKELSYGNGNRAMIYHLKVDHNIADPGKKDSEKRSESCDEVSQPTPMRKKRKLQPTLDAFAKTSKGSLQSVVPDLASNCFICKTLLGSCRIPINFTSEATETPLFEILRKFDFSVS